MSDRPFSPYNKIGLHVGPGTNLELLQKYVTRLDEAAIPAFVTAVSDYTPIARILEWTRSSTVPHTLVYYPHTPDTSYQFDFELADYYEKTNPGEAATAYWRLITSVLPSDLDRGKVWIGVLNDLREVLRERQADWLGEFGVAIGRLAMEASYKVALFGWQSGEPDPRAWRASGMQRFLSFCAEHPQQIAIALQEFSNQVRGMMDTKGGGIGRFRDLFAACDEQKIPHPTTLITAWGWTKDNAPAPERVIEYIQPVGELYAQYPEVKGGALWTLMEGEISRKVEALVNPLILFTLEHRFTNAKNNDVSEAEVRKVSQPIVKSRGEQLTELTNIINDSFNLDELRELTAEVGIDYEDLSGNRKTDKTRELVRYFERRDGINDLIRAVRMKRPGKEIPQLSLEPLPQPATLFEVLNTRFDESELRTLALEIEVDYDSLSGQNKTDKVLALIDRLTKRNEINKLLQAGQRARPKIDWGSLAFPTKSTSTLEVVNNYGDHTPLASQTAEPVSPKPARQRRTKTTAATPSQTVTPPQLRVTGVANNVRSGPGTNYPVIGRLQPGDTADILGQNEAGDWFNIELPEGTTAWLHNTAENIAVPEQLSVPIVQVEPPASKGEEAPPPATSSYAPSPTAEPDAPIEQTSAEVYGIKAEDAEEKTAETPNEDESRVRLSQGQARRRQFDNAISTALKIENTDLRNHTLLEMAQQVLVEDGHTEDYDKFAIAILGQEQPDATWSNLINEAAQMDNLDLASQMAEKIQDRTIRTGILADLARLLEGQTANQPDETVPTAEYSVPTEQSAVPSTQYSVPGEPETVTPPLPHPLTPSSSTSPKVWLYMADGNDDKQLIYLQQPIQIIWLANRNTESGDIILMYRTDPHQDIAHLFRAYSKPDFQEDTNDYAIRLSNKLDLERPLKRADIQTHPRLQEWSLARSPQGAMQRTEDIRAEGFWEALRGLLLAWNPGITATLAEWEGAPAENLLQEAIPIAAEITDSTQRQEVLLGLVKDVQKNGRSPSLLSILRDDPDRVVRRAARQVLGEPMAITDTLEEARNRLRQQQYQNVIDLLISEAPEWQSSANLTEQSNGNTLLAQAYEGLDQPEIALTHWQKAAELDPANTEAFEGIGRTTPEEKLAEVEQSLKEMHSQASQSPGPSLGLATIAERRDDLKTAASYLDTAVANATTPAQRQQIENKREVIIQYLPQPAAAPALLDEALSEAEQKLIRLLRNHFNQEDIKNLCVDLGLNPEELPPSGISGMARELVLSLERLGRLAELEARIFELRPHITLESAADIIEAAQNNLKEGQYQAALDTLQNNETRWQNGIIPIPERASAHGILAQAFEKLNQPEQAYPHWKKKAALLPNAADAFEGIGRTAPANKIAETEQFLEDIQASSPEAVGPAVGLAELDRRQGNVEEATRHLEAVPTTSLVQRKRIENEVTRLRQNPAAAPALHAPERPTGNLAGNELSLTLHDLMNVITADPAQSGLSEADHLDILQKFIQQTLQLPTLSLVQKRDLRSRTARVLVEAREAGQVTPELLAELHLPALDNLFITKPGHRRALLRAVETYRRLPYRRLWLYLRSLARRNIVGLLREPYVSQMRGEKKTEVLQESYQTLKTAVWSIGHVVFPGEPAKIIEQLLTSASRPLPEWRKVEKELVITGNLGYTAPDSFFAQYNDRVQELWGLLYDLLYNRQGSYEHLDSWGRFKRCPLENLPPTILLHTFYPQEHLPYNPKMAKAVLTILDLKEKIPELDYHAYVSFAQTLLCDEDLGFASLDDVGCFLDHLASRKINFFVDEKEETKTPLQPPLIRHMALNPTLIDTELTLPPSLFNQMSSALNTGNHIILIGPPGTGKTSIALDICRLAHDLGCSRGIISVTATADWTTFDTVGGYMPTAEGQLTFSEGIFLRAIREQKWLIIDEINRAEIDKAFGELFTVLSGQAVVLPYRDGYHPIRILPAGSMAQTDRDYVISPTWRVIGTMNVYDKASLFEMSYAFMRRFAFVDVGIPDDSTFISILNKFLEKAEVATDSAVSQALRNAIFKQGEQIMENRPLGPAIARDIIRYVGQRRQQTGQAELEYLGEAFLLYAIPQFDGLEEPKIMKIYDYLSQVFRNAPDSAVAIRYRLRDLFPHYAASFPSEEKMKDNWPPETPGEL